MSWFYVLISKSNDTVLCEYTEHAGNFQQITRMILRKIKKNIKCTIEYDHYSYHYINENEITYMCLCISYPVDMAFAFLEDIKNAFLNKYDQEQILNFCAYQVMDFDKVLTGNMTYYNMHPTITKNGDVITGSFSNCLVNRLVEDSNLLLNKDEKWNLLVIRSGEITTQSKNIKWMAEQIQQRKRMNQCKNILIGVGGVIGVIILYYLFFS